MSSKERQQWKDMEKKDKERYKLEMAIYSGPTTLPKCSKRFKKDKSAPKRPMSAYYSMTLRSQVIRDNPYVIDNREISKILGIMWKNATEKEKEPFINKEKILRAKYIHDVKKWRKVQDERIKAHQAMREEMVQRVINNGTSDKLIQEANRRQMSDVEKWQKEQDERIKAHRAMREEMAQRAINNGTSDQLIQEANRRQMSDIEKWQKEQDERIKAHQAMREEMAQRAINNGTSDQLIQEANRGQISEAALQHSTMKSEVNTKLSSSIDDTDTHREKGFLASCNQSHVSADFPADNATKFRYTLDNAPGLSMVYNQDPLIRSVVHPCQQTVGILRPLDHTQAYINQIYSHLTSHAVENQPGLYRISQNMRPQADMQIDLNPNTYAYDSLLNRAQIYHGYYFAPPTASYLIQVTNIYL
jgi:hypothetical protein